MPCRALWGGTGVGREAEGMRTVGRMLHCGFVGRNGQSYKQAEQVQDWIV